MHPFPTKISLIGTSLHTIAVHIITRISFCYTRHQHQNIFRFPNTLSPASHSTAQHIMVTFYSIILHHPKGLISLQTITILLCEGTYKHQHFLLFENTLFLWFHLDTEHILIRFQTSIEHIFTRNSLCCRRCHHQHSLDDRNHLHHYSFVWWMTFSSQTHCCQYHILF